MKVDIALVEHVAANARLRLSAKEKVKFSEELGEVIAAFSKLKEVDTAGTEPRIQPIATENRFREDEPGECLTQEEALANTEQKRDGYFKGPKAL